MTEMLSDMMMEFTRLTVLGDFNTHAKDASDLTGAKSALITAVSSPPIYAPNIHPGNHNLECILGWKTGKKDWIPCLTLISPFFRTRTWALPNYKDNPKKKNKRYYLLFKHKGLGTYSHLRKLPVMKTARHEAFWAGWGGTELVTCQWHMCWRGHCNSSTNTNVIVHLQKWHLTHWPFRLQFITKLNFLGKLIWKVSNSAITQHRYLGQGSGKFSKGTTFITLVNDISSSLARWVKWCFFPFDPLLPWSPNLISPSKSCISCWTHRLWLLSSGWTKGLQ